MYHVAKDYLPEEARYMIRYHSFYPAHKEGDYEYLMSDRDKTMFKWVREFQNYDLYSKSLERPNRPGASALLRATDRRVLPAPDFVVGTSEIRTTGS